MKRILLALTAIAVSITLYAKESRDFDPRMKLHYAEQIISNFYVDSVPAEKMVDNALVAMLKTLDPHSSYTDREETKQLTEPLNGNFSGVGIQFKMHNDTLYVVETIKGGPSEKAGIIATDRIVAVNDTSIAGCKLKNTDIQKKLRGPKGTVVNITVKRRGVEKPLQFRIIRDDIPMYSVDASYMVDDRTGYIKLSRFAQTTTKEMYKALTTLSAQGMTRLILDLEDNTGGYMQPAVDLAEFFLAKGDPIVSTEGDKVAPHTFKSTNNPLYPGMEVVVMMNQYSASASEILAGALQDNDRATIVGRRSFGKGLVQRPFDLPDGSMIRLTIARYHTPSGRCIQKPYTAGERDDYESDIADRYRSGEFYSADSIQFNDSLRYTTLRKHRTVYGGGGIMPDVFVAVDTMIFTPLSRDLIAKGILKDWCMDYVDANRAVMKQRYADGAAYAASFEITDEMFDSVVKKAGEDSVEVKPEWVDRSGEYIRSVMKALIGSDLYGHDTYYRVMNRLNPVYLKALEQLR